MFFDRFGAVLGCQHGAFLEPKINQNATYELLIFIDFILVFPLLLRLGGSYVGSISVLFAHRFLHRFLVDLGIDFGALLGAFGGSKSIIFGINFGMIFACRSKSGLRVPKSAQERPKSAQEEPKRGQERPKRGPRAAPKHPMSGKESETCIIFSSRKPFGSIIYIYI